ncbi:MAG: SDR family oxidoreductase [Kiritimatiellae bacterium]|nr:SDR family oxidoreductase [Kiritimatiellia bacterium]
MQPERTVLVTGGTCRIGKAIAEKLRGCGWRVAVSSHRSDAGADYIADFTDPGGAVRLFAKLMQKEPGLCAIVNNAALFRGDDETLRNVNYVAPEKLTMLLAGREDVKCSVVNILDTRVLGGLKPQTVYEETKRDLLEFTQKAAGLFADTMRVNGVAPGPVLPPVGGNEPAGEMLLDNRPTPEDIADAVAFLLDAKAVTGCVIPVDSGQHLLVV